MKVKFFIIKRSKLKYEYGGEDWNEFCDVGLELGVLL